MKRTLFWNFTPSAEFYHTARRKIAEDRILYKLLLCSVRDGSFEFTVKVEEQGAEENIWTEER
jgi:hypothetical protein